MFTRSKFQLHLAGLHARYPQLGKIVANLNWLTGESILRMVVGVVVGAWVARYLGPASFGLFNRAGAWVALAAVLVALGMDTIVKGELIRSPEKKTAILGTALFMKLIAGAVSLVAILAFVGGFASKEERWILGILSCGVMFQALGTFNLWFQATLQTKRSVLAANFSLVIFSIVRVILIVARAPLVGFAAAAALEIFLTGLLLMAFYRCDTRDLHRWHFDRGIALRFLQRGFPLLLSGLAVTVYMRIDLIMLGDMVGDEAVGVYSAAARISELPYFIPSIVSTALFPSIIRTSDSEDGKHRQRMSLYFRTSASLAYLITIPTVLLAPFIVHLLFGQRFTGADSVLVIHIWALVFVFMGVAREQYLVAEGLLWFSMLSTLAGALLNVGLNLWLIPDYGPKGAAIATVISYGLSAVISSLCYPRTRGIGWVQLKALFCPLLSMPRTILPR